MATRESRGKSIKNNNRNYNDIIEEEKKKNNFVDISPAPTNTNNLIEELNNFSEKIMQFGKYKNKSFQALYLENYNYCLWLSETIQEPKLFFYIVLLYSLIQSYLNFHLIKLE